MKRDYTQGESALTVQNLIESTETAEDISVLDRRNRLSHLRTFARVIGKPPAAIPATVETLRAAMKEANPVQPDYHTSTGSW